MDGPTLTRSWPSLAAVGAGLIQLALGAGATTAPDGGPGIRAAAVALLVLGAASAVWGVITMARGRPVIPRVAMAGALAAIVACALALAADPVHVSVPAVAAASVFLLLVAGFCAVEVRNMRRTPRRRDDGRTGVIGILIGAAAVAALVTPVLATTDIGAGPGGGPGSGSVNVHSH